jgi:hypothetical protein
MRISSVKVRLALALAVAAVLSCATIWLIRPSFAVTLAEKNKQSVSSESPNPKISPDQPNGCVVDPNNPAAEDCASGLRKCGSGRDFQCCGPKEACCTRADGSKFCSSGRCPS